MPSNFWHCPNLPSQLCFTLNVWTVYIPVWTSNIEKLDIRYMALICNLNPISQGLSISRLPRGGGVTETPLRNQWRSYYWTHVAKNYLLVFIFVVQMQKKMDKILNFGQFFVFSAEMKNIGIELKWLPIGQMWIFLGLVFCKHPYFYCTNWFCNKNIGL